MSEIDEIKSGLSALANHAEAIGEAFLHAHGRIANTEQNSAAINMLRKKNLVHLCTNSDDVALIKSVKEVLGKVVSRYKTKDASAEVQYLWDSLVEATLRYHEQLPKATSRDIESLKTEIESLVWELSDSLIQSTADFSYLISDGCRKYESLDLRICENERVLKEASKLNKLIIDFSFSEIDKLARFDPRISGWMDQLIISIGQCRKDMEHSLTLLNVILNELKENAKHARLIAKFNRAFESETGLNLNVDSFLSLPYVANVSPSLANLPHVDTSNILYDELLSSLCPGIRKTEKTKEKISSEMPVSKEGVKVNESRLEIHEAAIIAKDTFDAVIDDDISVTASQIYDAMAFDISYDIWVFVLLGAIDGREKHLKDQVDVSYDAVEDPSFNGNRWIRDVILVKKAL